MNHGSSGGRPGGRPARLRAIGQTTALPPDVAGATLRQAFPAFCLFVVTVATIGAGLLWPLDAVAAGMMAAISITTVPSRQLLMPAINAATDQGLRRRFNWLHSVSVSIPLAHIAAAGAVLVRLV